MITSIKTNNVDAYKALFEEAADILSGYKRVRTYDSTETYYTKNPLAQTFEEKYPEIAIEDLTDFANKLKDNALYIKLRYADDHPDADKAGQLVGIAEGFDPMIGITSLEEYFAHLAELSEINRKYTILPLDEPHFEINTNTRAIAIPSEFKKNGVAVQGDDLAEILYFKVDRYFDYMDLNNCDIFIQWEAPKGADGKVVKSVSSAYIRDIESEPGKLIFGWVLDDSITATSGTLKFSVRFFQWENEDKALTGEEKVIAYSLSTLTASVAIQPSININPETENIDFSKLDDVGARLLERIENSQIVGGYAAVAPEFIVNLIDEEFDYGIAKTSADGYIVFDGTTLRVVAWASDTGAISYAWKKQALNKEDNVATGPFDTTLINENIGVEVEKVSVLPEKFVYYTDKNLTQPLGGNTLTDDQIANENVHIYARYAGYTIDTTNVTDKEGIAGAYWAVATNRITNSSTSQDSVRAVFPHPKDITIVTDPVASGILVGEDEDKACILSVVVEEADDAIQKKTYKWYYDTNSELSYDEKNDGNFIELTDAEDDGPTYTAKVVGRYKVRVFNTRNMSTKNTDSAISRVTEAAKTPIIAGTADMPIRFSVADLKDTFCPTIELDSTVESDGYTVEWYLYEGGTNVDDGASTLITTNVLAHGVLKDSFNPVNFADHIKEVAADKDIDGAYYPIIINNLNGSTATTTMPAYEDMFLVSN